MSESPLVFNVSEGEFEAKVIEQSRTVPVVVDFWAPWCGPCLALGPRLEKAVSKRAGQVLLAKVNTEEEQNLAMQFGISSIPYVVAFRGGQPVLDFVGAYPDAQIEDFLDRILPSEADRKAEQAKALEASNPTQAEQLYREALRTHTSHEAAVVGLARVLTALHKDAEAGELLEQVGTAGELGHEAERLRSILAIRAQSQTIGDEKTLAERAAIDAANPQALYELGIAQAGAEKYPEALKTLLQAASLDRTVAREKVRPAMVQIFHIIGLRSEMADEYRDQLTRLLY